MPNDDSIPAGASVRLESKRDQSLVAHGYAGTVYFATIEWADLERFARVARVELNADAHGLARLNPDGVREICDGHCLAAIELNGRGHAGRLRENVLK